MQLGAERGDAALAIEEALTLEERALVLSKFRRSNLNGAAVADILDILDNGDALLQWREPFYEDHKHFAVRVALGWQDERGEAAWRWPLIGMAVLAVALLTERVPEEYEVVRLLRRVTEGE